MKNKVWILGPCSIESEDLFIECLSHINGIMDAEDDWYMKASFDKANRTSLHGGRGPRLDEAIKIWETAKKEFPNVRKELLAVAKLSQPLLKNFTREALIKVKLDF